MTWREALAWLGLAIVVLGAFVREVWARRAGRARAAAEACAAARAAEGRVAELHEVRDRAAEVARAPVEEVTLAKRINDHLARLRARYGAGRGPGAGPG